MLGSNKTRKGFAKIDGVISKMQQMVDELKEGTSILSNQRSENDARINEIQAENTSIDQKIKSAQTLADNIAAQYGGVIGYDEED